MIEIFLFQAYYSTHLQRSEKHLTIFTDMEYGFKKDAQVSLRFSNLTSKIVFGFATKKIIKHLKSLNSCLRYCDGQEKVSDIQFFINTNDTSFNFTIPSKSVLTPYSISCDEVYKFNIELNILNTKNHLDYRIQAIMIFDLVFFVLIFLLGIIFIVYLIFSLLKDKIFYMVIFSLMSLFMALHSLLSYIYINNKKKQEFFTQSHEIAFNVDYFFIFICFFIFLFALQLNYQDCLGCHSLYFRQYNFFFISFLSVFEIIIPYLFQPFIFFLFFTIERIFYICIIFISPPYWPFRFVHYFACIIHFYVSITYSFFIIEDGKAILDCNVVITRDVTLTVSNFLVIITAFLLVIHDNKKLQVSNSYENLEVQIIDSSINENTDNYSTNQKIDNLTNQNIDNSTNQKIDNLTNQNIDNSTNQNIDNSTNQKIDNLPNQNIGDSENENSNVLGKKIIEHL